LSFVGASGASQQDLHPSAVRIWAWNGFVWLATIAALVLTLSYPLKTAAHPYFAPLAEAAIDYRILAHGVASDPGQNSNQFSNRKKSYSDPSVGPLADDEGQRAIEASDWPERIIEAGSGTKALVSTRDFSVGSARSPPRH
jgi:hypothetical protein